MALHPNAPLLLFDFLIFSGFAKNVRKNKNHVSGCSKKYLKHVEMDEVDLMDYWDSEDYYNYEHDNNLENTVKEEGTSNVPSAVNLLDFAKPKANPLRSKKR